MVPSLIGAFKLILGISKYQFSSLVPSDCSILIFSKLLGISGLLENPAFKTVFFDKKSNFKFPLSRTNTIIIEKIKLKTLIYHVLYLKVPILSRSFIFVVIS